MGRKICRVFEISSSPPPKTFRPEDSPPLPSSLLPSSPPFPAQRRKSRDANSAWRPVSSRCTTTRCLEISTRPLVFGFNLGWICPRRFGEATSRRRRSFSSRQARKFRLFPRDELPEGRREMSWSLYGGNIERSGIGRAKQTANRIFTVEKSIPNQSRNSWRIPAEEASRHLAYRACARTPSALRRIVSGNRRNSRASRTAAVPRENCGCLIVTRTLLNFPLAGGY